MPKKTATLKVQNINGFHVRPATTIAKEALKYQSNIFFYKNDEPEPINAKSSLDIILASIAYEDNLLVECEGVDAEEALEAIKKLAESVFDFPDAHAVQRK